MNGSPRNGQDVVHGGKYPRAGIASERTELVDTSNYRDGPTEREYDFVCPNDPG
jgi:hypothetical protein